jgi:MraZ protein
MFRGQFAHAIDAKGRVSVPARFREELVPANTPGFVLAPDPFDPCLHLYPLSAWEDLERRIASLSPLDPNVVRFRRVYVSAAVECELDKAGRVLIPPSLRERVGLVRDALFAGTGLRIELWAKERWDEATALPAEDLQTFRNAVMEQFKL